VNGQGEWKNLIEIVREKSDCTIIDSTMRC